MSQSINQITAAANGIWIASALAVALFCAKALIVGRNLPTDARQVLTGTLVAGMCVAGHRLYWNIGIWLRGAGDSYATWAIELRPLPSLFIFGIALGAYMALRGYARELFGRHWWLLYIAWIAAISAGSALLA